MKKTVVGNKPKPIQFTKEGLEKMQGDFDRLTTERVDVLVRLQTAREMGDLSENGAYKAARFELGSIDRQLRKLTYLIRVGVATEPKHIGVVDFGSRVTLDNGIKKLVFQMVSGYESNPSQEKLSVYSPIGKAIMGKREGDVVKVQAPAGELTFTIVKVE